MSQIRSSCKYPEEIHHSEMRRGVPGAAWLWSVRTILRSRPLALRHNLGCTAAEMYSTRHEMLCCHSSSQPVVPIDDAGHYGLAGLATSSCSWHRASYGSRLLAQAMMRYLRTRTAGRTLRSTTAHRP